jgi:hypothetical protein
MGFRVFLDGKGSAEKVDTQHSTRPEPILNLTIGDLGDWPTTNDTELALTLLAEEMGYANYGFVNGLEKVDALPPSLSLSLALSRSLSLSLALSRACTHPFSSPTYILLVVSPK